MLVFGLWAFVAWFVFSIVVLILAVGKPRRPLSAGNAAASVVITGLLIAVLVGAALQLA